MGIFDGFLKQLATGDTIADRTHASKLFVDNNYARSPKYSWLYHVFFQVSEVAEYYKDTNKLTETGMLVSDVTLPSYQINTQEQNSYNRKEIIQSKITYNPVSISFHDDQSEIVRNFWYDYMNYYYRDTDMGYSDRSGSITPAYHMIPKYLAGNRELFNKFGYTPRQTNNYSTAQFLHSIKIYSLHQKRFSEYTLINPIITSFSHDQHSASAQGTLTHKMDVQFTTVLYASGYVSKDTVAGFADLHYDKSPSPLTSAGGGTNSILGPGGILSAVDSITGEAGKGNYGGAAFTALRAFQKNKNADLKGLAKAELLQATKDVLSQKDPRDRFFIPQSGALSNLGTVVKNPFNKITTATAGAATNSATSNNSSVNFSPSSYVNPTSLTAPVAGTPSIASGINLLGTNTASTGALAGADLNKIVEMGKVSAQPASASSGSGLTNAYGTTKVQATKQTTAPTFSGFFGSLGEIAKDLGEKAQAAAETARNALASTSASVASGSGLTNAYNTGKAQEAVTKFTTGTNNAIGQATSALANTPYGNSIKQAIGADGLNNLQAAAGVAGSKAQEFIKNGNFTNLSGTSFGSAAATTPGSASSGSGLTNAYSVKPKTGKSTNPAPATTGINLGGDIPS